MQELIKQEQFEIEVLDKLNTCKLLDPLLFGGGTMLRLCHGLERFSVDLDFWFIKKVDFKQFFILCQNCLKQDYVIKDAMDKHYTLLLEISSKNYPRNLKIEMRKEIKDMSFDNSIAYSTYTNKQVLIKTAKLDWIMKSKINTFLVRQEIRDCFDLEFLIKKGIEIEGSREQLKRLLKMIDSLSKQDYKVKLGSILEEKLRKYYIQNKFKILRDVVIKKVELND